MGLDLDKAEVGHKVTTRTGIYAFEIQDIVKYPHYPSYPEQAIYTNVYEMQLHQKALNKTWVVLCDEEGTLISVPEGWVFGNIESVKDTFKNPTPTVDEKPTNPKDAVGIRKAPLSTLPANVLLEAGTAMLEGACKYGRHNYREAGVRASVYYDGTMRHLMSWWEGEDLDPDSGLSHITKAISSLITFRDAMMNEMWTDDRPPKSKQFMGDLNKAAGEILDKYPKPKEAYTNVKKTDT